MHTTWTQMSDPGHLLDSLGIDQPAELEALTAMAGEVRHLAFEVTTPSPSPHDDRFTPENIAEAITAYVTAVQAQEWARTNLRDFERVANDRIKEVYRTKAAEYLPRIAEVTTQPAKDLTKAAEHLRPGDTADAVLDRGQAAIRAWKGREQLEAADSQLQAAMHLTAYFALRLPDTTRERRKVLDDLPEVLWWLDITDHTTLEYVDGALWEASGVDRWLAVVQAGHKIKLATPKQAIERAEAVERSRRAAKPSFADPNEEKKLRTQRKWLDAMGRT